MKNVKRTRRHVLKVHAVIASDQVIETANGKRPTRKLEKQL